MATAFPDDPSWGGMMIFVAIAVGAAAAVGVARLIWRYTITIVDGSSMEPTLWAGDRLLVRKCPLAKLRRGDIVVVRELATPSAHPPEEPVWATIPPPKRLLVKRAIALPGDPVPPVLQVKEGVVPQGAIVILGDHPSEHRGDQRYGYVHEEQVVGRAVRRLGE